MTLLSRIRGAVRRVVRRPAAPPAAATIDFDSPAVARDPFPWYETLRAAGPVQYLARHEAWIVLGHDEVQAAFTRPDVFSNQPYDDVDAVLLAADPPEHTPVRAVVTSYFTRDVVEELGAFAGERARTLLRPRLDAVRDYGQAVSEAVAARLLGLDDEAVAELRAGADRAADFPQWVASVDGVAHRARMFARLRGDGFDDARARSLVRLLWMASTKTTERVIAQCVLRLLRHDDVRAAVQNDHALIGRFVEEVMRLHQPEPMLRRRVTQRVQLGGADIPAGAVVYLSLAAANRDPSKHEQPSELRLDRRGPRHFAFGHGIHHCVGATLARVELHATVRALLVHAPDFRAAQPLDEVRYRATMTAHFIDSLLIETGLDTAAPLP